MMKNFAQRMLLSLALSTLLTVLTSNIYAQWNTNTSVNLQISSLVTADMQSASTTDGKMWVAFYNQNGGNYDMRAQLIDADGNKLLGPDGILVSNQTSGSATYVFNACVDGSNNLIVSMQDQRSGTLQAVLYKISQTGTHLWGSNGIILGEGLAPYSAVLTNGEVVSAWNESSSNTLNIQKITTSGTLAWTTPVAVTVGPTTTTRGQLIANLGNKFTMVYQKRGVGISTTLYAQHFDNAGTPLYAALQISSLTSSGARYYSIEADADTTYFGYYVASGSRFNSYLQRINPDGTIPYGMNGSNFNTSTGSSDPYQGETSIRFSPGSLYVWSVCSFSNSSQSNYGVYIQKFNKVTGARQFTDLAKMVYPITANRDIHAGRLALVNDTPMFMSYDNNYVIYATRLDASGNFAWPLNRVEISSTTASMGSPKGRYGFTAVGPNRCAGVWTENRGSADLGYAQGITIGGLIGIDVATLGGVPATITTSAGTLQMEATIFPASASQSVTWSIVPVTGLATISASGLVSALGNGTVWAKAVAVQDVTLKDSLLVTLTNQVVLPPTVITLPATNISLAAASLNGTVNANNFNSTVSFEWGLTTAYGNNITASPAQVTGSNTTPVMAGLTSLAPGTTYHFRCVAVNAGGTTNGLDQTFTTNCLLTGNIGTITGASAVCAGSTANVYSVNPYPGATSYVWTLPAGATITAGNNTNSITVSYSPTAQSGDFTVYATDGTCLSYTSAPFAVTVSSTPAAPGAITGTQILCEGDMGIQYSVPPVTGATSYTWSVPPGAVIVSGAATNTIIVNFAAGSSSGNITVFASNDCGIGSPSNPLPVTVAPLPASAGTISGPATVCEGSSAVVYSVQAVANAYAYVWTLPAGLEITSGANTNQITVLFTPAATSGNITVYGTNGNCLGQTSAPLYVTVNPIPATPLITRIGDTLVSSSDSGNQWYLDGVAITGATGREHIALVAGYYSVVVTINGCSSAASASLLVLPVSLYDNKLNVTFEVSPNPNTGAFDITAESGNNFVGTILIYNSYGAKVWSQENTSIHGAFSQHINLQELPAGTYLLVLRKGNNSINKKFVITR